MKKNKLVIALMLATCVSFCTVATYSYADNVENDSIVFEEETELSLETEIDKLLADNEKQAMEEEKIAEELEKEQETKVVEKSHSSVADKIESIARAKIGSPYSFGSVGPYAFDCSGFTTYVFNQVGISLPRVASSQAYGGKTVSKADLQKGDLVFFNTMGGISHVGVYIGSGNFIHASSYSRGVIISNLNESYYASRYITASRYL